MRVQHRRPVFEGQIACFQRVLTNNLTGGAADLGEFSQIPATTARIAAPSTLALLSRNCCSSPIPDETGRYSRVKRISDLGHEDALRNNVFLLEVLAPLHRQALFVSIREEHHAVEVMHWGLGGCAGAHPIGQYRVAMPRV